MLLTAGINQQRGAKGVGHAAACTAPPQQGVLLPHGMGHAMPWHADQAALPDLTPALLRSGGCGPRGWVVLCRLRPSLLARTWLRALKACWVYQLSPDSSRSEGARLLPLCASL